MSHIHSKPIVYTNNGGGRDTYISQNDGGFRPLHRAGHGKATYFNQLRQYPEMTNVSRSAKKSGDYFVNAQDHYNPRFKREMNLVSNY